MAGNRRGIPDTAECHFVLKAVKENAALQGDDDDGDDADADVMFQSDQGRPLGEGHLGRPWGAAREQAAMWILESEQSRWQE